MRPQRNFHVARKTFREAPAFRGDKLNYRSQAVETIAEIRERIETPENLISLSNLMACRVRLPPDIRHSLRIYSCSKKTARIIYHILL